MKAIESHYVCSTKKFIHGTHIMLLDTGMFNSRYSLKEHTHTPRTSHTNHSSPRQMPSCYLTSCAYSFLKPYCLIPKPGHLLSVVV